MESERQESATPGTTIVRGNTPRPLVREEKSVKPDEDASAIHLAPTAQDTSEFVWLFEYGLGMDGGYINSPEHLHGLALFYGPAVVKGYHLVFGTLNRGQIPLSETLVTIVPTQATDAEVWGMLYRIPRRITQAEGELPSLLDRVYATHEPHTEQSLYHMIHIIAYESRRKRDVSCIAYVVTAQSQFSPLPLQQVRHDPFVERLVTLANKQKLPEHYVKSWVPALIKDRQDRGRQVLPTPLDEQNTEPLPIVSEKKMVLSASPRTIRRVRNVSLTPSPTHWLMIFACYLLIHLLAVLALLMLQGLGMLGSSDPLLSFKFLVVPWLVLLYGLLGGSMSGIITLARSSVQNPPHFVMITWFARPYIGAALALLAYLLLNSQLLALDLSAHPHSALSLLLCTLAGFSEGWLFTHRE